MAKRYIGVDIGSYNIKLCNITVKKNKIHIDTPVVIRTPPLLVQNSRLVQDEELLSLLQDALRQYKFTSKKVIIILNDTMLVTRDMEVPFSGRIEMENFIRLDVSEYLPFGVNEYTIRHKVLIPSKKNPKHTNYVLVSIIKNNLAMDFYEVFQKAGLKTIVIDSTMNSLMKYFTIFLKAQYNEEWIKKTSVLLDIGASHIKMVIVQNGLPVYQQVINQSSQRIDVLIANALDIERDEAETYKKNIGLRVQNDDLSPKEKIISSIMNSQIDVILSDIYKHLQAFNAKEKSKPVEEIWLCGGMAGMNHLASYIKDTFNLPCSIIEKNEAISYSPDREDTANSFYLFANIAGAAHRGD